MAVHATFLNKTLPALAAFLAFFIAMGANANEAAQPLKLSDDGLCLILGEEQNKRKAGSIVAGRCDGDSVLRFEFNSKNYLEADGRCIDYQEGEVLWMYDCKPHPGKEWEFKDGKLYNLRTEKCLAPDGRKVKEGVAFKLDKCRDGADIAFVGGKQKTVAELMGVDDNELPGLGQESFTIQKEEKDYIRGEVMFAGVRSPAFILKLGRASAPSLVLAPETFPISSVLPSIKDSPLENASLSGTAITVVLNDGAEDGVAVRSLPKPLQPFFEAAGGERKKVDFKPGLGLYGLVETKSSPIKDLLKLFQVRDSNLAITAQLSPLLVTVDHQDEKSVDALFKKNTKAILQQTRLTIGIPAVKLPYVDKLVSFERPEITITGDDLPVLGGGLVLKLPGKELSMRGTARLSKDKLLYLTGVSSLDWKRVMGLPFLDLGDIGVSAVIGIGNVEVPRAKVAGEQAKELKKAEATTDKDDKKPSRAKTAEKKAKTIEEESKNKSASKEKKKSDTIQKGSIVLELYSTASIGGEEFSTSTEFEVVGQKIKDFSIGLDDEIDLGKVDGFKKIPGINEFAFSNVRLASWGAQGEMTWTRTNLKGRTMLMLKTDKKKADGLMMMRVEGMKLGAIVPGLPKDFAEISFGESMLYFSDKSLDDVTVSDLPDFGQSMLAGLEDDPDAELPIYDGVGLIGALGESSIPAPIRKVMKENMDTYGGIEGPLMFKGALGNITKGKPNVTIGAKLPSLVLPKNQPLSRLVSFDKVGTEFFIRLIPAATSFQLGLAGEMQVGVPQLQNPAEVDKLNMRGELFLTMDPVSGGAAIRVSGQMQGEWRKPFGVYDSLTIRNPAVVVGFDTTKAIELGIGGDSIMKVRNGRKTVETQADFVVNLQLAGKVVVPKKLGVRYATNQIDFITYTEMLDESYRGVLTGPIAQEAIKAVPGPQQKVALYLQDQLRDADLSIQNLLQLDKIPLPLITFKDVELFFATPGATIPGREETMDTIGGVIAGKMEMSLQGKNVKLGETENRITLKDGLKLYTQVKGQELGPIKFTDSHVKLVASFTEVPTFEVKGSSDLFGAKSDIDVRFTPLLATIESRQELGSLLEFDFKSFAGLKEIDSFDDLAKADFQVNALLRSDPRQFLQDTGLAEVRKVFGAVSNVGREATRKLDEAKAKVSELDRTIAQMRDQVRRERRSVTDALKAAQNEVNSLRRHIDNAARARSDAARRIRSCNQTIRICTIWFFGCRRHETIPDLPARGICEIRNTPPRVDIVRYTTEIVALEAARASAELTLEAVKRGATLLPVDADPRVAGPLAARDIAQLSLDAAKLSVSGVAELNKIIDRGVDVLTTVDAFKLRKGAVKGSLNNAIRGEPIVLELAFDSFGQSVEERIAFSLTDAAYNAEQLTVIALGIATEAILREARKIPILPHGLLRAIEDKFAERRAMAEAELRKAVESGSIIPISRDSASQSIASRIEGHRSTLSAKLDAQDKAQRAKVVSASLRRSASNERTVGIFDKSKAVITIRALDEKSDRMLCLDATGETNDRGASRIVFNECVRDKPSQFFVMAQEGQIHDIGGQCLDYQEKGEMWLYQCTGHPGMKWEIRDNRLYNPHTDKCLRGLGATIRAGTPAEIDRCQSRSAWAFGDEYKLIHVNDPRGRCLQSTTERNHRDAIRMVFDQCQDTPDQTFLLRNDGRMMDLGGRCLDYQEGGRLWLYRCGKGESTHWDIVNGNLRVANNHSRCVRNYNDRDGGHALIDVCSGQSADAALNQ